MRLFRRTPKFVPPTGEYVADPVNERLFDTAMWHLNGISWHDYGLPPEKHECWPQTKGLYRFRPVWRCACGAMGEPGSRYWWHKNETLLMRRRSLSE